MPDDSTAGPAGRPAAASPPDPPWWRRRRALTVVGGAALIVAAAGTGAALASGSSGEPRPIPAAHAYASPTGVLAAMNRKGVVCTDVGPAGQFMDCSGASQGDTVIGMFNDHAQAVAYADGMVTLGLTLHTPTAEVVGPNWVVNTSPAFADEVVDAIGGQVITKANAQPTPTAVPATAWPASVIEGGG
ncbi:MAG TPA: hypothetical protein VHZ33_32220 [Trebonia sp.]|nr:hypothetical protein [Trebonia sp.]